MRTNIGCVAVLLGMMGCVTDASALGGSDTSLAEKRGLSPIIVPYTPVIVAQASQAKVQGTERTIGICHPIENQEEPRLSAVNSVSPLGAAVNYLQNIEHKQIDWLVFKSAKMTLLQAPTHGELRLYEQTQTGRYLSADYSYEGPDSATVLVEVGGYKVKVIYQFVLMSDVPGSGEEGEATDEKRICPNGYMWKITTTPDVGGNITVTSVEDQIGDRPPQIGDRPRLLRHRGTDSLRVTQIGDRPRLLRHRGTDSLRAQGTAG